METRIRRKLSMAERALAFELAQPSGDASHQHLVDRLQQLTTQATAVVHQEREGGVGESAARARRHDIDHQLRHLARVAVRATRTDPTLAGQLVPPSFSAPNRVFSGAAESMLQTATAMSGTLVAAGLGTAFLASLTDAVAAFNASGATATTGRLDHVGAHADFGAVAREIMELVRLIDGLNAVRFKDQPKLLAEWKAAKNVFGSVRAKPATAADGTSAAPSSAVAPTPGSAVVPTPGSAVVPTPAVTQAAA